MDAEQFSVRLDPRVATDHSTLLSSSRSQLINLISHTSTREIEDQADNNTIPDTSSKILLPDAGAP